ncbi:MAG: DsrE family protein [Actinomycetia bacterium]|nr:DsrE family protein [Actinomycetes bacterium]
MAKLAFWIMSGPDQAAKALAALRLADRLKSVRHQEVQVYLYGPGVRLAVEGDEAVRQALRDLGGHEVPVQACPVNVQQLGLAEDAVRGAGVGLRPAGEVLVELVEQGYQVIGV